MKAKLVYHSRNDLIAQRRAVLAGAHVSEAKLRDLADSGHACGHERDVVTELDGIDFMLGDS